MNALIATAPAGSDWVEAAITDGGGRHVEDAGAATGLVWTGGDPQDLRRLLSASPRIEWIQLPAAGVERYVEAGVIEGGRRFTCAKGAYGEPVAEHALMLAMAGLRGLSERLAATSWGSPAGTSLFDQDVTIVGAGGIAESLLELLAPFRTRATVVRRRSGPVPGAARTLPVERLAQALSGALVVFVAVALTPATNQLIDADALAAMDRRAWLVNVARGPVVDTEALVAALDSGTIAGAALDVTDPEPLPDGHRLWGMANCLITPHTADTSDMIRPLLARRIAENVRRFGAREPLLGLVDPAAGY